MQKAEKLDEGTQLVHVQLGLKPKLSGCRGCHLQKYSFLFLNWHFQLLQQRSLSTSKGKHERGSQVLYDQIRKKKKVHTLQLTLQRCCMYEEE